jgi:SAM-dependent methyltransferase
MNGVPKIIDDKMLYGQEYFLSYYLHDPKRARMYELEYERIRERCAGKMVLDIGCGVGAFLAIFDDRWKTHGYEPSEFARTLAAQKGIKMLDNLNEIESESMDLVIFRGTLQHINTPITDLAEATRILRKGGLLAILATPDTESAVYKIWHQLPPLDAPRNWVLFGNHFLQNILKRLGFEKIEVIHPYWNTPYANPLNDFSKFVASLLFGYRKIAFPGNMMEIYARKA